MSWKKGLEQAIADGDRDRYIALLGQFYDEAYPHLFLACRKEGPKELAEDAINDVFVSLIENPKPILQAGSLIGYIRKMAINRIKASYSECVSPQEVLEDLIPAEENGQNSVNEILDKAKMALSEIDYRIVLLKCIYRYSFKEIGKAIGIGEDAAAYRYKKAVKALRRLLQ